MASIGMLPPVAADWEAYKASQWSPQFETYMRNRLLLGGMRYGKNFTNEPGKPQYDRVKSIRKRLDDYEVTGNLEKLVDVANLCMLEFEEGRHPLRHFRPGGADEDEAGEHVERVA